MLSEWTLYYYTVAKNSRIFLDAADEKLLVGKSSDNFYTES
jgi:hypothetical protein